MDPKSNAGNALSNLNNTLNTGSTFGAPQFTPPGTPAVTPVEPAPTRAYTPPSFVTTPAAPVPNPAPQQPAPSPTIPPVAPTQVVTPRPTMPVQTPPSQQVQQATQQASAVRMAQPVFPPPQNTMPPITNSTKPPLQPAAPSMQVRPTPTFGQPAYTPSAAHMDSAAHMISAPTAPQRKSRLVSILSALLGGIVLLITAGMYLYGKSIVQNGVAPTTTTQTQAPANGFQVTESGVTEPNFDQQGEFSRPYQSSDPSINTDTSQMFAE